MIAPERSATSAGARQRADAVRTHAARAIAKAKDHYECAPFADESRWSAASGGARKQSQAHFIKLAAKDGVHVRNPDAEYRPSASPYNYYAGDVGFHPDHGDSTTRVAYGDHNFGRTVKSGEISPSASTMERARPQYMRSPHNYMLITSGPEEPVWKHGAPKYGARGVKSEPYKYMPPPRKLLPPKLAGEMEVLVGFPRYLPPGIASVYLSAESDDGAYDASDRMHVRRGVGWSGSEGSLGGALVLTCHSASKVTLHVMAESKTAPSEPARTLGGTTIALPTEGGGGTKQRLFLVAPLEITVELAWVPKDGSWKMVAPTPAQQQQHQQPVRSNARGPARTQRRQQTPETRRQHWAPMNRSSGTFEEDRDARSPRPRSSSSARRPTRSEAWKPTRPSGFYEWRPYGASGASDLGPFEAEEIYEEDEEREGGVWHLPEGHYDEEEEVAMRDDDYTFSYPDDEIGTWKLGTDDKGSLSRAFTEGRSNPQGSLPVPYNPTRSYARRGW